MDVIYCRGGNKNAPVVAQESGMSYGTRHDYTSYGNVYFVDINWKNYTWHDYVEIIRERNPVMAMTPDYEAPEQRAMLEACINDLRTKTDVERILVCPKFTCAVSHIPDDCIVALSVPAPTYAGFLPDLRECTGRKIHLLGGNPHKQVDLIRKLRGVNADVVSVDGNYLARKAALGSYFRHGRWIDVRGQGVSTAELEITSACNIISYIRANKDQVWKLLI